MAETEPKASPWPYLLNPLRAGLQAGGSAVAIIGLIFAIAEYTDTSARDARALLPFALLALLGAVAKRGYPLPPIGRRAAIVRLVISGVMGLLIAVLLLLVLNEATRGSDVILAVVLMGGGALVAVLGRYPRIYTEGPLVTADELARADDVLIVVCGGSFAVIAAYAGEVWRPAMRVMGEAELGHPLVRVSIGAIAGLSPVLLIGLLALGRRGRSPVDKAMALTALPVAAAVLFMIVDGMRAARAEAAATTMLDVRAELLAGGANRALATGGLGLGIAAVCALLLTFGLAFRARAHGVAHDPEDRRHLVLVGALSLLGVLVIVTHTFARRWLSGADRREALIGASRPRPHARETSGDRPGRW